MSQAAAQNVQYVLLFRDESQQFPDFSPEQVNDLIAKFVTWTQDLDQRGKLANVSRLAPEPPKLIRRRDGALAVDGPYAESKELINGFVIINATDEAEALTICETCPMLDIGGSIELRLADDFPIP